MYGRTVIRLAGLMAGYSIAGIDNSYVSTLLLDQLALQLF